MSDQPAGLASNAEAAIADEVLHQHSRRFGAAGLAAATRIPGLLAAVDQHAAAIRDRLTAGAAMLTELASYADGLIDRAAQLGWRSLPAAPETLCTR